MTSFRFFIPRLLVIRFPLCDVLGGSGAAAARSLQAGRGQTQVPFHGGNWVVLYSYGHCYQL